jgi:putative heme-binding domain-containing protein
MKSQNFGSLPLFLAAFSFLVLPVFGALGAEPWADDRLPRAEGLELWFDASRQNAGRGSQNLPPLASGNSVDYLLDGSGHRRSLAQPLAAARPRFRQEFYGAFVAFDGIDDALTASGLGTEMAGATVFIVGSPWSNAGGYRAIFGLSQAGRNDYTSGINFDQGEAKSTTLTRLNAEGAGFGGEQDLLAGPPLDFGAWHLFSLVVEPGPGKVRLFVDGRPRGSRDRASAGLRMDEFVLGARHYSNTPEPPATQGHFHGSIAEFLLYNTALAETNRGAVERYLLGKYGLLLNRPPGAGGESEALVTVTNAPPAQFFAPGFAVRELPIALSNINNVKYRPDGKLVALGYNGQIHLLSATNGGGLENKAEVFWGGTTLRAPIGMALTPPGYSRGQGVFVAAKGKVSLIVDTNGDDRADTEIVVAEGWKELSHGVDALGVALDRDNNIYFGLGTASFTEAYLVDKATGQSRYDLKSERGTILKVSADFTKREIVCTGIRFPVGMAFNREGDLFCTDQEGATWLPNGNPFDELLWIQPGRHYGFPPRHPKYLPGVTDEPSVFDFGPQHQSTCGLNFNEPVNGGPVFGPASWAGDAIVCGYSRGKIWRTKLAKTANGYIARAQLIASLPVLTVDACVSPTGDLVVATHGGEPDWGSGPNGQGRLFKASLIGTNEPQPALVWVNGPGEIRVAFDRPLAPAVARNLVSRTVVTQGKYVSAGDRFEIQRPGYGAVYRQLGEPRNRIPVLGADLTPDRRTLILRTAALSSPYNVAITLGSFKDTNSPLAGTLPQVPDVDLATDPSGVEARWRGAAAGEEWQGWLPHLDLVVARQFTEGSAEHDAFWPNLRQPGVLTLRGQLDLFEMLQPAIQPGSRLDYDRPAEDVSVVFSANEPFTVRAGAETVNSVGSSGGQQAVLRRKSAEGEWVPFEISLKTGPEEPRFAVSWFTADDARPRPLQLRRCLQPWVSPKSGSAAPNAEPARPELTGGNWLRGKRLFFGEKVACHKCHTIRGEGNRVGPDLSNLVQRDYASVFKDISRPSAALNPDHLAYNIQLADGEEITAVLQTETASELTIADATGKSRVLPRDRVKSIVASSISLMPEGLDKALSADQLKDLMTFLLTQPLEPAPIVIQGEPPARAVAEVTAALGAGATNPASTAPLSIVLCAGPKDHGPGEHDYPLWQKRWTKLLALADGVTPGEAWEWPSAAQWNTANVVVFYSDNPGWSADRAAQLESYLARGGGAVFLHYAVDGHANVEALARSIGLAWRGGFSKFRHGALDMKFEPGPLTAGLSRPGFFDESYWNLVGGMDGSQLVASGVEEGEPRPLMWTRETGPGRVFVSIPGHFVWTFDDPIFRLLILRGICWSAHQPVDRLSDLATIGARVAGK